MIQRIQTLFLLAAAGLLTSMVFTPMIKFTDGETVIRYIEFTPTLIMLIVTVVLSFVNIFSFKNRMFQIRVCNLNTLICVGFQLYLAVKYFQSEPGMIYSVTAIFPILAAILTFIGMRYVARDEAMVQAAYHLRDTKRKRRR